MQTIQVSSTSPKLVIPPEDETLYGPNPLSSDG